MMLTRTGYRVARFHAALMLLVAGVAFCQSGSGALRAVEPDDFYFLDLRDPLLYPEAAYEVNPAALSRMAADPLGLGLDLGLIAESVTLARLDDSIGDIGGTYTRLDELLEGALSVDKVFHFGKKRGSVLSVSFDGNLAWDNEQGQYRDYNSFSESTTTTTRDTAFDVGTKAVYALASGTLPIPIGVSLGYSLARDPAKYTWVTDQTLTYIDDVVQDNDIYSHVLTVSAGTILGLSRSVELGASVRYVGGLAEGATSYTAVDAVLDGHPDTIMPTAEYVFYTGDGGPAEVATSYAAKDLTVANAVHLSPSLRVYIAGGLELFVNGSYSLLDRSRRTFYERVRLASDVTDDVSSDTQLYDAGLTSFDALAGMAIRGKKGGLLKVGVGFSRDDTRFSQDGTTAEGLYRYNTLNTNKYTELALGTDPVNNSIADSGEVVAPTRDLTQSVTLLVDLLHKPAKDVGMFLSAKVTGSISEQTYHAYNLDTWSVWSETVRTEGITWLISPVAGVYFPVGKKAVCVVDVTGTNTDGSASSDTETAPVNSSLGASQNGAIDLTSSVPVSFAVNVRVVLGL